MFHRLADPFRPLLALALVLASLTILPLTSASAQTDSGLIDDTTYRSPQFGYEISWQEPWQVRDRDVLTNPGGFDTITLRSLDGVVRLSGRADSYDPLTFLQDTVALQLASGAEVINLDTTADVPTAELQLQAERMRLDVVSLPEAGAVVLITLRADELDYDIALESAQTAIQLAGQPLFDQGAAPAPTAPAATEAVAPTEAAATVAPTEAAAPTETPTDLTSEGGIDGSSYTSPNFGFSVSWDPAVWTVPENAVLVEPDIDMLNLESATGPIFVTGMRAYDGDAATCLAGEEAYIQENETGLSEWQLATDANGNPMTGSDGTRAWGVFTNTYTDPDDPNATPEPYVDYLECVSLGDGASVAIFHSFASREVYNEHIGNVTAVVESFQPGGTAEPGATAVATDAVVLPTEAATEAPGTTSTPDDGGTRSDLGSGDTVSGESFGYSFTIPAGWQATSAELGGDIERTELTNGTSTVTVEARQVAASTLSDCVTEVASEHQAEPEYPGLALAETAAGDPFTGEDAFSAFANYTFTGADGEPWAHFIECRWIVEGESALLVIQDVPEEMFGSERGARRQIQNSIQIGQ